MGSQPKVSAVVVNWNAGDCLAACVEALIAGGQGLDFEVVVVDNASSDGSVRALDRFAGKVRLVQTGENLGFGRGVNRGVAASAGAYLAVLNPDVVLRPGALERMVAFLEAEGAAGIVGPRLTDAVGRVRATCGPPPGLLAETLRKFLLHLIFPFYTFGRLCPPELREVGWVTGACFVARREALEAVGGMDEAIFMYYEDVDLCLRVRRAGWRVFYLPEAEGAHAGGQSSRQALERMLSVSAASYAYFVRKHFGKRAAAFLCGLAPVEMALRCLLWGALFLVVPGRRPEARARLRAYWRILRGDVSGLEERA